MATPTGGPSPALESPSARVLVVDDDVILAKLMARILARAGHSVTLATSAAEALAFTDADLDGFDVLVSDVNLADGTGVELAHALRSRCPPLRVLLVSGVAEPGGRLPEIPGGGYAFCAKPFGPSQLIERVRELLGPGGAFESGVRAVG
jgi:DNA-binding NtrC family response regulator